MHRIALIGAGSVTFAQQILSDLLSHPATREAEIRLMDIDRGRLQTAGAMLRRMIEEAGTQTEWKVFDSLPEALRGADYVISSLLVGGRPAIETDFAITAKYGIQHTVGDTLGVSGIMRAVRTIPALVEIAVAMDSLCPNAVLLNYTNPMSMLMMAVGQVAAVAHYGLCHSSYETAHTVARYLDIPAEELEWKALGINHMAWMITLRHHGRDVYPDLFARLNDPATWRQDAVRFELMKHTGYFVTESSKHNAEYTSYFITHPDEVQRLGIPLHEYLTRPRRDLSAEVREALAKGDAHFVVPRSGEYAPRFVQAAISGEPWWFQGNVENRGHLIDNLPASAVVEVPCFVNAHGVFPVHAGSLPRHLAALTLPAIMVQELTVDGVLRGDREAIYHAVMVDPQASARLKLDEMRRLVDELLAAHGIEDLRPLVH